MDISIEESKTERTKPPTFEESIDWASKKKGSNNSRKHLLSIIITAFFITLAIIGIIYYITKKSRTSSSDHQKKIKYPLIDSLKDRTNSIYPDPGIDYGSSRSQTPYRSPDRKQRSHNIETIDPLPPT